VLPVLRERTHPVLPGAYEGEESERTCSTPALPRTSGDPGGRYLMKQEKGEALGAGGTDYVIGTTNKI